MKIETLTSYNVQIWVGLQEGYTNNISTLDDVETIVKEHIKDMGGDCLTITPTKFLYVDGEEDGVVVGYINYPRFPREEKIIKERSITLGKKLLYGLKQNRLTITTPKESIMLSQN